MGWSYSGDPRDSDKDSVRFLVGDTDNCDKQLEDEEILYLIETEGGVLRAAKAATTSLIAKFARLVTEEVGDVRIMLSERMENYKNLCKELERRANQSNICFIAGGLSKTDKDRVREDLDRIPPFFTRRLHENKKTARTDRTTPAFIEVEEMPETKTISVALDATSVSVVFAAPQPTDEYNVSPVWKNTVDTDPQFQDFVISAQSTTGFTLSWNAGTDSANYIIVYTVHNKS